MKPHANNDIAKCCYVAQRTYVKGVKRGLKNM